MKIIFEDNHIIAVDKIPGVPVQKDITGAPSLLCHGKNYIKEKYHKPGNVYLGLVHRLDKPVSGVIIFARTSKAAQRLHSQLLKNAISKFYIAVVKQSPMTTGREWIILKNYLRKRRGYSEIVREGDTDSKVAILRFIPIKSHEGNSLLLVQLVTGRKHQIRAQLNNIGSPIGGDTIYSAFEPKTPQEILLHSYCISFEHPVSKVTTTLYADIPRRFERGFPIDDNDTAIIKKHIETVLLRH